MPQAYKILGQMNPTASTTLFTLYTVPASAAAVISSLCIANIGASATTYRIAMRPASATAVSNQHYLAFDAALPGNDTTILTLGASLETGGVVSVYAGNTAVSVSAFGVEIT
jgi:hypothetical protein